MVKFNWCLKISWYQCWYANGWLDVQNITEMLFSKLFSIPFALVWDMRDFFSES